MQHSINKLRNYFKAEHKNGYTNKAVIGGLAKVLDFWESEARSDGVPEDVISLVSNRLRDYHRLSPQSRADILKGLWKRVQGDDSPIDEGSPTAASVTPQARVEPKIQPEKPVEYQEPSLKETPDAPPKPQSTPQVRERVVKKPASRSSSFPGAITSQTPAAFNASLEVLHGVGPKHANKLEKLGLYTLGDMLFHFPRRYDDYSNLRPIRSLRVGDVGTVIGQIQGVFERKARGGKMTIVEAVISDDGFSAIRVTWFNQPWLMNRLSEGLNIAIAGKIEQYLGRLVMNNPDWEPVEIENLHTNRIVPIYPLTESITQKALRELMDQVIKFWTPRVIDPLPKQLVSEAGLMSFGEALFQVHFPDDQEFLKNARDRLAFDEIFYLQLGVSKRRKDQTALTGRVFEVDDDWMTLALENIPFTLTNAQNKVVAEIRENLRSGSPMNRLIQGDVGSGKTVVALLAARVVANAGGQTAVMAPTSILAEQHYENFRSLLVESGLFAEHQVRLLTGDTNAAERESIQNDLHSGELKFLIGTHALIEDPVQFNDLQLIVIDEQHRFGVHQRSALRAKGNNPHLLVMTATPIPRSLALTLYGDLDLSIMDEMPAGREPVKTFVLRPVERERAYTLIRGQIKAGFQVFVVYPLIEESDKLEDVKAAVDEHKILSEQVFKDLNVGLLHGKMKPAEKDQVMMDFRNKKFDILVSTTVIEVGVDVPNATVILIEGANRFGLAQLHQLRGRVGRGGGESYCLLIPDQESAVENERLQAMVDTFDGFKLAEMDMKLRGPGEFLGTKQSGFAATLKMASLTDIALIEKASKFAREVLERDPDLVSPENALMAESVENFWNERGDVS